MQASEQSSSGTSDILSGLTFNANSDVLYTKPKLNKSGGKSVGILNSHTKKGLYINTPLMLTWGVNKWEDENTGKKSYDMSLQFPSQEYQTEPTTAFLKNMVELENKFKADAIKNCKEWMNKNKLSAEVVDALWTPLLRYPKDKETGEFDYTRAPTLRIKIPFWDGEFNTEIYDVEQNKLFPNEEGVEITDLITKAINVATIIQCGGMWFANGKFGVTWRLLQCVVKPKQTLRGKCHINLSDTDKEKLVKATDDDDDDDISAGVKNVAIVDDSDDDDANKAVPVAADNDSEDEDEDEDEEPKQVAPPPQPTPPPEPAPTKKRVVRKKQAA